MFVRLMIHKLHVIRTIVNLKITGETFVYENLSSNFKEEGIIKFFSAESNRWGRVGIVDMGRMNVWSSDCSRMHSTRGPKGKKN